MRYKIWTLTEQEEKTQEEVDVMMIQAVDGQRVGRIEIERLKKEIDHLINDSNY